MWNDNEAGNYEGLFARTPDQTQETIWGTTETHTNPLGPDTVVQRDWYGQVRSVEDSWGNW